MFSKALFVRVIVLCLSFSTLPTIAHSAEIEFPKRVTIKWQSSDNQLFYIPGEIFILGKQVNKKVLDSETKKYCTRYFGFTNISVKGKSGRIFGTSNTKNTKFSSSHKFVSGGWILNGNGEDVYELIYRCSGEMSVAIKGRSSAYSFGFTNLQMKFKDEDRFGAYAEFSIEELEQANWTLSCLFPKNWNVSRYMGYRAEWSILKN